MPRFSIIIPVYNCKQYLPVCVDSVLEQTFKDYELLLIDDGSTDGSGDICDTLSQKYSQVKVLHKENGGAASARNVGIDHAMGAYMLFLDSDDTIEPNTLHMLKTAMSDENIGMAMFGIEFDFYDKGEKIEKTDILGCKHKGIYKTDEITEKFKSFFEDNSLSSSCNKCFRRDILTDNDLHYIEGMAIYEDMELVLRYLKYTQSVICLGEALYHYRITDINSHLKTRAYNIEKLERDLSILIDTALELESKESAIVVANLYIQMLEYNMQLNRYSASELSRITPRYCSNEKFKLAIENKAQLNANEKKIYELVEQKRFAALARMLRRKRAKEIIRRWIKCFLKAIHLYR